MAKSAGHKSASGPDLRGAAAEAVSVTFGRPTRECNVKALRSAGLSASGRGERPG